MTLNLKFAALLSTTAWLASCATNQAQLSPPNFLKTEWALEDLGGKEVSGRAQATLAFPDAGRIAGNSFCNRFFGSVETSGDAIKIGQLGTTRRACLSEELATQESKYLAALQNAERISLESPYLLIRSKGWEKPLRFIQIPGKGKP